MIFCFNAYWEYAPVYSEYILKVLWQVPSIPICFEIIAVHSKEWYTLETQYYKCYILEYMYATQNGNSQRTGVLSECTLSTKEHALWVFSGHPLSALRENSELTLSELRCTEHVPTINCETLATTGTGSSGARMQYLGHHGDSSNYWRQR